MYDNNYINSMIRDIMSQRNIRIPSAGMTPGAASQSGESQQDGAIGGINQGLELGKKLNEFTQPKEPTAGGQSEAGIMSMITGLLGGGGKSAAPSISGSLGAGGAIPGMASGTGAATGAASKGAGSFLSFLGGI